MLSRRSWGIGLGAATLGLLWETESYATTALGVSLETLVAQSDKIVLGLPSSSTSAWELVRGSRRIVTTTRLIQEEDWLEGVAKKQEILVSTLGGRVGDLAQKVPGEARLLTDEPCIVFLGADRGGRRRVVAMGQGHYPIEGDDRIKKLRRSPSLPHLVGKPAQPNAPARKQRAVDILSGKSLSAARDLIRSAQ